MMEAQDELWAQMKVFSSTKRQRKKTKTKKTTSSSKLKNSSPTVVIFKPTGRQCNAGDCMNLDSLLYNANLNGHWPGSTYSFLSYIC